MEKELSITLPADDDEMLPRQCPNCKQAFLIHQPSYSENNYLNLRCPYCEWIEEKDEFLTDEQAEYAEAVAANELRSMAEEEMEEVFEDAFSGLSSTGGISIETDTSDVDFGRKSLPSPHINAETYEVECDSCGFIYAVTDPEQAFCPVCRE